MRHTTRQPSWNSPRKASATRMNANAVPWPARTRSAMPMATVDSQTPRPVGTSANGRLQNRVAASPAAAPAANGQNVSQSPARVPPAWWLCRPIATKSSTQQKSARAAPAERIPAARMPPG